MYSWYSALRARPFSTCCLTLRTTRATRRARAAPRVQISLTCTGNARCTTHNASQRARENAPLVLLSSALRSSGATRARSLCFIRGPTHITRTDVWVSCGDTLSLFKRRGNPCSGNCCTEAGQRSRVVVVVVFLRNLYTFPPLVG